MHVQLFIVHAHFTLYISIYSAGFWWITIYERKMRLVLNPIAITKRFKKNVSSLAGHSVNFLVETVGTDFLSKAAEGMPKEQGQLFLTHLFELNISGVLRLSNWANNACLSMSLD